MLPAADGADHGGERQPVPVSAPRGAERVVS
jgi:hypothetical protein